MGKGKRLRAARLVNPKRNRAAASDGATSRTLPPDQLTGAAAFFADGLDADDLDDDNWEYPPQSAFNTSRCPLAERCAGCGATDRLRVAVSVFTGGTSACATVCDNCDGRSLVHLLGFEALNASTAAHAEHQG
jgi:hypothetical protein